jgi:hypothetical protein
VQGDAEELQQACANLSELDLTSNLISDFMSIAGPLTHSCTRLQVRHAAVHCCGHIKPVATVPFKRVVQPASQALNLSDNQVVLPPHSAVASPMPTLRAIVLNDCRITWQQVGWPDAEGHQSIYVIVHTSPHTTI